jgi:phospholipase C
LRPSRALPYELDVHAKVEPSSGTVVLKFINSGDATAVFQVRSANTADVVRNYTVESGKELSDSWNASPTYNLSVYGPNGFVRFFAGSTGAHAAELEVTTKFHHEDRHSAEWKVTNVGSNRIAANVTDAYTGNVSSRLLSPQESFKDECTTEFYGWYDVIVTVEGDSTFNYRLAGHVESGQDSFSDPALSGLVTLKA